jgi:hypothetical protein
VDFVDGLRKELNDEKIEYTKVQPGIRDCTMVFDGALNPQGFKKMTNRMHGVYNL